LFLKAFIFSDRRRVCLEIKETFTDTRPANSPLQLRFLRALIFLFNNRFLRDGRVNTPPPNLGTVDNSARRLYRRRFPSRWTTYFGFARFTTKIIFEGKSYFGQRGGSLGGDDGVEYTHSVGHAVQSILGRLHARDYFRARARVSET